MTSPGWLLGSLIALAGLAVLAAIIYTFLNRAQPDAGAGIVRPLLALILVGGLIILAGASFASDADAETRNLLIGGIVASASGVVAFYFASRVADEARKDLLKATMGTDTVPDLSTMTVDQAKAAMVAAPFSLVIPPGAQPADPIKSQQPPAGTDARRGSSVTVEV
ncbi:PASTA domain-containing protein [Actinoplanes bogorensis]|uniref:PASTA domain-containing protein n=1 Tax=Paractinoplanes bogorensis TaxID=1610840 RepID=A0ABS5YUT9_9ACTN|nr:PASTA domain-containing protein [Actinoplanes bogorensis]MBU2667207.1 PASTA domain-containing protein [Actinoplanes bogorensis]